MPSCSAVKNQIFVNVSFAHFHNLVINKFVDMSPTADAATNLIGWQHSWFIFAGYALAISILFIICFKAPKSGERLTRDKAIDVAGGDPEGMPGENHKF